MNRTDLLVGSLLNTSRGFVSELIGLNQIKGVFFGLVAAVLYAIVIILNKKIQVEDAYNKTIIQLLCASLILLPFLPGAGNWKSLSLNGFIIVMILVVGLVHTGIAYALYFKSMKNLKAGSIAILSYIDPVFALLLSACFLHEKMTAFGLIGAIMIIGAAIVSESTIGSKD